MISALNFRIALIALAFVNFCKPAVANPTNPTVVNGTATITNPNASTLQITNSPGAIINWRGFSINPGEITQFLQSSPASAILNRVTGTDPSQILGTLQSNGRVFLINPNGIVFGAGAVVDVQGLIASTLDISNNDFLNGNYNFLQTGTGAPITLQNGAQITTANAGNGGQVWLIARSIEQAGNITTPGGQTILAAGTNVQVASSALGNMVFNITTDGTNDIQSLGTIAANQGVAGLFADNITHSGTINAQSVAGVQGQVVMNADNNLIVQDGGVINANSSDGSNAGKINLTAGNLLEVQRLASVSADGDTSGGNGGQINLTAYDLRVSSVANAGQNLHASARNPSAVNGTVTLNQTGNFTWEPQGEFRVSNGSDNQNNPSSTALADGGYVVTWSSYENGNIKVYARRYDANGNALGSEFVVVYTSSIEPVGSISATALPDGGFLVTWTRERYDSYIIGSNSFYAQRYDASGNAVGSNFIIRGNFARNSNPRITALADGGFVATWIEGRVTIIGDNSYNHAQSPPVVGQRYDASGNVVGSNFIISSSATGAVSSPSITALADGSFVATWRNSNDGIYARRYDANTNALGSEFLISNAPNSQYSSSSTTALADGGFVTTWTGGNNIYARRYDANANALGSEFLISNRSNSWSTRSTIALADGDFMTIWTSNQSGSDQIYAQRYDKVPAPFTQDNNQVTDSLGIVAGFNSRPGLSNGVLSPPPLPSKVEQQLALSNALCATLSPSANREPLAEGENSERLISTNGTGLNCSGQSNSQMHSDAIGKGWNNSTQAPPQEQAYAQMVGEQEYTLTRAMSWKARQAYWNEHSQKQSTLSAEEYANYLNQVGSLSESERVQRYEQLGQQLP